MSCANPYNLWILPYMVEKWVLPYIAKDVISNFERRRTSRVIQMGLTCHHKCHKKKTKGDSTDGRWEHGQSHRGEGSVKIEQRDAATSQGWPTAPEAEKAEKHPSAEPPREEQSRQQPGFGLLALEPWEYILLFKLPSLWYSLQLPQETNTDPSDMRAPSPWN